MKYFKVLKKMYEEKEISYSLVPKTLVKKLIDDGLIAIKIISGNRKKIIVNEYFLKQYQELQTLEEATTRAELTKTKVHSKIKKISPMGGLYLNGICNIEDFKLPITDNSVIFLKYIPKIEEDILVICVENFENIIYFKNQLYLFEQKDNILFVFRNAMMLKFIQNIKNDIIYFCDFDLAGISIYLNEILPKNNRIKLFIPLNIHELIKKHGITNLYEKQFDKYKNLTSENPQIQELINIIHEEQKTLEQEFFINNDKAKTL